LVSPNEVRNAPLRTHPVPISPAVNPDAAPQSLQMSGVGLNLNEGLSKLYKAKIMRTIHSTSLRILGSARDANEAPITVAIILGIPKSQKIRRSRCFQNSEILLIFPKI
jgi:hypothetical protein